MAIDYQSVAITTDALGAGTATFPRPINGYVLEVRSNAASFSATADFTITRKGAIGGTIVAFTNNIGPWTYAPRADLHTTAGGTATAGTAFGLIPVAGEVQVLVAQGGNAQAGTVHIIYDAPR